MERCGLASAHHASVDLGPSTWPCVLLSSWWLVSATWLTLGQHQSSLLRMAVDTMDMSWLWHLLGSNSCSTTYYPVTSGQFNTCKHQFNTCKHPSSARGMLPAGCLAHGKYFSFPPEKTSEETPLICYIDCYVGINPTLYSLQQKCSSVHVCFLWFKSPNV